MKINDSLHGFTVKRVRPVAELGGEFIEMTHDKTGLELCWLSRKEENKTFSIAFETLPWNDTGVFHILEHSVLCGSDKYQVKEPFVELLKSSMNTFLNAFTFPDKTMYPVCSRNPKDFLNLISVYLDAVFHPLIYSKPEIFYQEGWHYEFDENGVPGYKGVVFNEMKGAYADADELMVGAINQALFPQSPYGKDSGGNPAKIPDLSYEEFIDSHRRFYAPSNAYIFLDGDMDIDAVLALINDEYLASFEHTERMAPPKFQSPVKTGEIEVEYELGEGEDPNKRQRMAWAGVIGSFEDLERLTAVRALANVLAGSNQSPLNKAILSQGLAEEVNLWLYDGILQPYVVLEAKNFAPDNKEKIEKVIFDELARIAREGVDKEELEAALANLEFKLRERDYGRMPQGLAININALESWLYGGDPAANLEVGDLFVNLKKKMNEGYFEKLINDVLIDNDHSCKVVLKPSKTAGEERRALESARLEKESSQWTDEDKARLMEAQRKLEEWQHSTDSEEALKSLPALTLADVSAEPEIIPTTLRELSGIRVLENKVECSGIVYYSLYFDADDLDEKEISLLAFMCGLYKELDTTEHKASELITKARLLCGSLSIRPCTFCEANDTEKVKIKLGVSFSALKDNALKALEFVTELLTKTLFENKSVAMDLLKQRKTAINQQIVMSGSSFAMGRVSAQLSSIGVANECSGGYEYYKWLAANESGEGWDEIKSGMERLSSEIICLKGLTLSMTGADEECINKSAEYLSAALTDKEPVRSDKSRLAPWGKKKEAIIIPADIGFAVTGGSLLCSGGSYCGKMLLAARIVDLAYLWNVIRVQGGAYGAGMRVGQSGLVSCYSYRDPNTSGSLEKYKASADFLVDFLKDDPDLTGFIIGALADEAVLLTPKQKGAMADSRYWRGVTPEDQRKLLSDIISAAKSDLLEASCAIREAIKEGGSCIIGGKNQIDKLSGLDSVETL